MVASQSNLSKQEYGYDYVLSTTSAAINATIKSHILELEQPWTRICFVADSSGTPTQISLDDLKGKTGVDPFDIPADADPASDPGITALRSARFMAGFRMRLGVPQNIHDPRSIPDLVELTGGTYATKFNMLCQDFDIIEFDPGGYGTPSWTRLSQGDGVPWVISARVDLRMSTLDDTAFSTLPPETQETIKNLKGDTFSIQQLLFDFANAGLHSELPRIMGVEPGSKVYMLLSQYFLGAYFATMKQHGEPIVGVAVTQKSIGSNMATISDLALQVNPLVDANGTEIRNPTKDQARLITLSYLCSTGKKLPHAKPFSWNWVSPETAPDCHGIAAINRTTLIDYFEEQLLRVAQENCCCPVVEQKIVKDLIVSTDLRFKQYQMPTVTRSTLAPIVLQMHYEGKGYDQSGLNGYLSRLGLQVNYDLSLSFAANRITVSQHLVYRLQVGGTSWVEKTENVFDKTIEDVFVLGIAANGQLTAERTSTQKDDSKPLNFNWWQKLWGGQLDDVADKLLPYVEKFSNAHFDDIPLHLFHGCIFPGGRTFSFKDVRFSEHQDLISQITYAG